MPRLAYDLHIHSCLSPCGNDDMTPADIVGMAALKGLDVIALTDHGSAKNCPALFKCAQEYGITAIAGLEVSTAEEIHVVCLMPNLERALDFGEVIYSKLPPIIDRKGIFGQQLVLDADEKLVERVPHLLSNATSIGFDELYDLVGDYGGLFIPAHIDRPSYSILSQLGYIPPDSRFACAELRDIGKLSKLCEGNPYLNNCNIITSSDAHQLCDINEATNFIEAKSRSVADILDALGQLQVT